MTIHELAHQVGGGLNNQQNQWTAQLKQAAPPCGWKGITMRKVVGMHIHLLVVIGVRGVAVQAVAAAGEGPLGCGIGEGP
jgi:hypothetical protein